MGEDLADRAAVAVLHRERLLERLRIDRAAFEQQLAKGGGILPPAGGRQLIRRYCDRDRARLSCLFDGCALAAVSGSASGGPNTRSIAASMSAGAATTIHALRPARAAAARRSSSASGRAVASAKLAPAAVTGITPSARQARPSSRVAVARSTGSTCPSLAVPGSSETNGRSWRRATSRYRRRSSSEAGAGGGARAGAGAGSAGAGRLSPYISSWARSIAVGSASTIRAGRPTSSCSVRARAGPSLAGPATRRPSSSSRSGAIPRARATVASIASAAAASASAVPPSEEPFIGV